MLGKEDTRKEREKKSERGGRFAKWWMWWELAKEELSEYYLKSENVEVF